MSDWIEAQDAALAKEFVDKIGIKYKDPVVDCQWFTWQAGRSSLIERLKELAGEEGFIDLTIDGILAELGAAEIGKQP